MISWLFPDRDGDPEFEAEVARLRQAYQGRHEIRIKAVQDEGDDHLTLIRITDPDEIARHDARVNIRMKERLYR